MDLDLTKIKTPIFIMQEPELKQNLNILEYIQKKSDCKILLALKGFAFPAVFTLLNKILYGTCASGPYEAMLGYNYFGKEVHVFSPAYSDADIEEIIPIADHIIFNSVSQWQKYKTKIMQNKKIQCGLRVNHGYSEIEVQLYNPCAPKSRFGILPKQLDDIDLSGISGLHFHSHCQQNSDVLARTLDIFIEKFDKYIKKMQWLNLGGGHHITRKDYDVELLIKLIQNLYKSYPNLTTIYLEPGEAVALNAGVLVASILDIVHNDADIAILDISAANHIPDVLEMPYRPEIIHAELPNVKKYTYRLTGNTCLAGDIIGDYSFDKPLNIGDKLIFCDMAIYSFVKSNMFNGIKHPNLAVQKLSGEIETVKQYNFNDYLTRLHG